MYSRPWYDKQFKPFLSASDRVRCFASIKKWLHYSLVFVAILLCGIDDIECRDLIKLSDHVAEKPSIAHFRLGEATMGDAKDAYRNVLTLGRQENAGDDVKEATYNLALIYDRLGNIDSARYFFLLCEQELDYKTEGRKREVLLEARSKFYIKIKEYGPALLDLTSLEQAYRAMNRPYFLGKVLYMKAQLLAERGEIGLAILKAEESIEIVSAIGSEALKERVRLFAEDLYQQRDSNLAHSLSSSANSSLAEKIFGWRGFRKQTRRMIRDQMVEEAKTNELKISQQSRALVVLAVFTFIFLGMVYALFRMNRKIKVQNALISVALDEKETLLREIHHRVKNNLQVISSLLSLQSRSIKDKKASAALVEGRSRVESMALIHQDLYHDNCLLNIQLKGYVRKLCENLYATYNVSGDRIELDLDIEEIQLDVTTLVPMGLIINELISNALKYAFPEERNGKIGVTLRTQAEMLVLQVQDNGIGMSTQHETGFGHRLISAFARKLDAEIKYEKQDGTLVSMFISKFKVA